MKDSFYKSAVWVAMLSMSFSLWLHAQEPSPAPQASQGGVSHLRTWAVLGDTNSTNTYSLSCEMAKAPEEDKMRMLFAGIKGCYRSGYGSGYVILPAGKVQFSLLRGNAKVDELDATLEKDAAYTLLAILENGTPKLKLVQEYPTPPEEDGIYIFNLLAEPALFVQIGESAPKPVSYSVALPFVIPAAQLTGPVTFVYPSKKKTEIRRSVSYEGKGRVSAVFMRNNYSRPSVFVYPSEPEIETPSDENSNDSQTN